MSTHNVKIKNVKFVKQSHGVWACPDFKQMKILKRWDVLRNVNYVKYFMQTPV